MQKFWIQTAALVITVFVVMFLNYHPEVFGPLLPFNNQTVSKTAQVNINGNVINAEVADTPESRTAGLGNRTGLAENSGMLFVFSQPGKYRFWMKGMQFSLDFIFIKDGQVVDILQNINPPAPGQTDSQLPIYESITEADMTLEVPSGYIDSHNIKVGDAVTITNNPNNANTAPGVY